MDFTDSEEKRAIRRYELQLPVTVTSAEGQDLPATAQTRDVSSHGICFFCDAALELSSSIEFTVTLPAEVTLTEPINVRCSGTVVRVVGEPSGKFAVAAAIESYEFVPNDEKQNIALAADATSAL